MFHRPDPPRSPSVLPVLLVGACVVALMSVGPLGERSVDESVAVAAVRPEPSRITLPRVADSAARLLASRPFTAPPEDPAWWPEPSLVNVAVLPEHEFHDVVVGNGDTFLALLTRLGVAEVEAHAAVAALDEVFDPRRLRVGQSLTVEIDRTTGNLRAFVFAPSPLETVRVSGNREDGYLATVEVRDMVAERALTQARVERSVDQAAREAGAPAEPVNQLFDVFKGHVDFRRETRAGDTVVLWYDQFRLPDGRVVRGGDLHYARMDIDGRTLEAFRFEHEGHGAYFDRTGQSLRRLLLRQPVTGYRISSGFGMRRHPILGYQRMHNGIDFAAPTGTPIYAAGAGRLVHVGRNGGYGNYVRIDHGNGFQTAYAHMSRFARGLRSGGRVRQGEVIGYVGSTGVSTGPHLHFEVLHNGRHVNPLTVAQPPASRLAGETLDQFRAHVHRVDAVLARERARTVAMETSVPPTTRPRDGG
ncbi:MAG: peptidoglycan DD-metalloendopeptidase family protein [Pseudomonadota bacterium]